MGIVTRRFILGALFSAMLVAGCNNDNFANNGVLAAGGRFRVIVARPPNPAHLLLDSATGDLWELHTEPAGGSQWVRMASGPTDVRVLTPQEFLGVRSQRTPTP